MKTSTINNIQSLRGIAVLGVIFFHLYGIEKKYSTDPVLPDILQIGTAGVDLFFLISGFIMIKVIQPMPPGLHSMTRFMIQRLTRIYPMYWLVSLCICAGLWITQDNPVSSTTDIIYILKSLLLLPQASSPILSVGWTLIHEMYFYCLFSILFFISGKYRITAIALWSLAVLLCWNILRPTPDSPWLFLLSNPLSLEFAVGCLIATWSQHYKGHVPTLLLLGVLGAISGWLYWIFWKDNPDFPVGGQRVICFIVPCAMLLAAGVALEKENYVFPAWIQKLELQKLGDASYSLYLTHLLFLSLGGKVWQIYGSGSAMSSLLWLPLLLTVALIGGMLCHYKIEKPMLYWLRQRLSIL